MLKTAPQPVDVQDLQFKLHCRLKVFDYVENSQFSRQCSLLACASRFGLVFIGTNTFNLQVIQLKKLEEYTKADGDRVDYLRRTLQLPSPLIHVSVNCEHTILAVVLQKNDCPYAVFYDVKSFWQKDINQIGEVRLSPTPGVHIVEVNWNPALACLFTACKSDGTLGVYEIKNPGIDINELPAAAGATCFCWSPKGKQIAVGSQDGKVTQYKPDLKAVKVITPPQLKEVCRLLSLQWVSNYQFIGVYQPVNPDSRTNFIVIDSPKTGESTYTNYDDICYSNGNSRPNQFYLIFIQNWNILMAASSNSMEVGILSNSGDTWTQWIMGDAARAELPLSSNYQETLPVGFALDIGTTQSLSWGESVLPPPPFLLLLSDHGTLCCFHIVNLKEGIPSICTPPDAIKDISGLQEFVTVGVERKVINPKEPVKAETPKVVPPVSCTQPSQPINLFQTTITSTPKAQSSVKPYMLGTQQSLNLSQNHDQPVTLFGGQATLTVVPNKNNNQATYTTKYQNVFTSTASVESKVTAAQSFIQVSSPLVSNTSAVKPPGSIIQPVVSTPTTKLHPPDLSEDTSKNDLNIALKAEKEDEKIFSQMVKEECVFLESQLKAILHQGKNLKISIGTDDEKTNLIENTKLLKDFFTEVVDICTAQNGEVHILKQNLLQSWAWYEEVKSRQIASENESRMILIRAQPLDSASEKQLADIRHAVYYLESQMAQAHRSLDEQWDNFQDYCKNKRKIQIPTMELIFQTMVKHNVILKKQSYILKDIATRIKSKSHSTLGSSLLISLSDSKDLPEELKRLSLNPEDICQIQYEHVLKKKKNFTQKKVDALRSFLKKRDYPRVFPLKPQLTTSIIQTSPTSKLKQLSLSSSKTSSILKEDPLKKLDFAQSTPKPPLEQARVSTAADLQSRNPIEGLQNFTLKFETKNFADLPEKTFTPLTKGVISGSPNSAFVSTSLASSVTQSNSSSIPFRPQFMGVSTSSITTTTTGIAVPITTSKALPTYVITTRTPGLESNQPIITIPTYNLSKPFSFNTSSTSTASSQENALNMSKFSTNAFSSLTTKPSFSFNAQHVSTVASSVFGTTDVKNSLGNTTTMFNVATAPPPVSTLGSFTITSVMTPDTTATAAETSVSSPFSSKITSAFSFGAGTTSSSSFSFGGAVTTATSFLGMNAQKPVQASTSSTSLSQTFGFSAKTVSTTINTTTTTAAVFKTSLPSQTSVSLATSADSIKVTTPQMVSTANSSISSSPKTSSKSITPSTIFGLPQNTTQSTAASVTFTTQTLSFITTVTSQSVGIKPSIFSSTTVAQTSANTIATTSSTTLITTARAVTTTAISTAMTSTNTGVSSTSLFGNQTAISKPSIFGSVASTTLSAFPSTTSSSSFTLSATSPLKSSIFGSTDSNVSKSGVFTRPPPATTSAISSFGTSSVTTTTQTSIFSSATSTSVTSPFGISTTTTSQSIFSSPQNQSTPFGSSTVTTASPSIFGSSSTSTTSQSTGFGNFANTTQKTSIFGGTPVNSTQSSIFGNSNQSVFGNPTSTEASVFEQTQTANTFGRSSVFGSSASPFGGSSAFGTSAPSFGQSSSSIFGSVPTTTSRNIFGGTPTTGSVFGSSPSAFGTAVSSAPSPFGSSNVFVSNTSQSSTFGSSTNTGSFGFGSLNVGSTATTPSSNFGSAANPFGGDSKSLFGSSNPSSSSTGSIFGSNTSSAFGSSSQSFGVPSFGGQSAFGQQNTFGQSSFGSNAFSQQPSGPFSAGSGTVNQSGFGGSPTFQKPGFGSPPVFGGSPAFGSSPSFGGAPAFGSPPAFGGGTSKVFGSSSPTFAASSNTQNAGFGNLANQPTVGFGNLAQQAANAAPSAPFSGNSSFSSWR